MASSSTNIRKDNSKWLDAFSDPLASLYTFTSCMALADLQGDGDHKLLIADLGTGKYSMTLKVYKGVTLMTEQALVDLPTAVIPFFMDHIEPRVPAVAVASGSAVYIYRNLKPYYKFSLPSMDINETEKEVWEQAMDEKLDLPSLGQVLQDLKTQLTFAGLTQRSQRYLVLKDDDERLQFISSQVDNPLRRLSCVTCLASMKKSSIEKDSIDCLVVGTEHGQIFFFGAEAFTVLTQATVPSTPVFLNTSGNKSKDMAYSCPGAIPQGYSHTPLRGERKDLPELLQKQLAELDILEKTSYNRLLQKELELDRDLSHTEWCHCEKCDTSTLTHLREGFCCAEYEPFVFQVQKASEGEAKPYKCITELPEFQEKCLDLQLQQYSNLISNLHIGLYDVEYRVLVCCRDGKIYTIKRGMTEVLKPTIELHSHAVGVAKVGKNIIVGCMDRTLRSYTLKGRRVWSMKMPACITAVQCLEYSPKQYMAALVALDNKQLHVYQDLFLVDVMNLDDVATGIHFGRFGREEGALILTMRGGGLNIKLFKRTAKLEEKASFIGPNPAQYIKLNIPKKTKIFVDQTLREREDAVRMHEIFQRDLFMLRLDTAKAYSKMLDTNMTPVNWDPDHMLKVSAAVQGFGPVFLLKMYVQTSSVQAVTELILSFQYNPRLYTLENNIIQMPMLVPGIQYSFQTKVTCVMCDKGISDDIRILVAREGCPTPILTAVVTMPVSEQTLLD